MGGWGILLAPAIAPACGPYGMREAMPRKNGRDRARSGQGHTGGLVLARITAFRYQAGNIGCWGMRADGLL